MEENNNYDTNKAKIRELLNVYRKYKKIADKYERKWNNGYVGEVITEVVETDTEILLVYTDLFGIKSSIELDPKMLEDGFEVEYETKLRDEYVKELVNNIDKNIRKQTEVLNTIKYNFNKLKKVCWN